MSDWKLIKQAIIDRGYEPKTSWDTFIANIFLSFEDELEHGNDFGNKFTIEGCMNFVDASGGLKEFDYE